MHLTVLLIMKTPADLIDCNQNELRYAKEDHNMMKNPKVYHLLEELNRKKICYFNDKYVTRSYNSRHITSWAAKIKNKTIFDLVTMSDLAYTVAVIENGHEIWKQMAETQNSSAKAGLLALKCGGEQEESSTKKTSKFTKKAGRKREYNISGWSYEGINFYNKLRDKWKRIASENKDQA